MKTTVPKGWPMLLLLLSLAACQKDLEIIPVATPVKSAAIAVVKQDTIPDKAAFKLMLGMDSINTDETMFIFNHTSSLGFSFNEDAPYFPGFGLVNLASISGNGRDLAINGLPCIPGMSIGLDVHVSNNGSYYLETSYAKNIPAGIRIWLKDAYLKDSIDVRAHNYIFKVNKADTNSYGNKRFRLVLKQN